MHRIRTPIRQLDVPSHDGTRLRVYTAGNGPHRWLLPPGLGTPAVCWKALFERFAGRMTIATWDLRGCYGTEMPKDSSALSVRDHAGDGVAVADALGWTDRPFVVGGWSLGVQISLETRRLLGERVAGLVLLNGAFEHVLKTALPVKHADRILEPVLMAMMAGRSLLEPPLKWALGHPHAHLALRTLGVTNTSDPFFATVMREFQKLDLGHLAELTRQANQHTARDLLREIRQPTLIVAGTHDTMTPAKVAQEMHRHVKASELMVVKKGTHYTLLEYPDMVWDRVEQFLAGRVFAGTW